MRVGTGGKAALAAAAALLALALAGPPLAASSATSAALQTALEQGCAADHGLILVVDRETSVQLDADAARLDHVEAPIHTTLGAARVDTGDASVPVVLVSRTGGVADAGTVPVPAAGEVLLPASAADDEPLGGRAELNMTSGSRSNDITVNGAYADVPVQPEPAAWCGLRDLLRTDGATRPPVLLADSTTVRSVAGDSTQQLWELRPDGDGLTRSGAEGLLRDLRRVAATAEALRGGPPPATPTPFVAEQAAPGLQGVIDAADDVGASVRRSIAGLQLVALAVAVGLLVAVAAAMVRERRDELALRATRGEGTGGLALRIAEIAALPALAGTVVGTVAAVALVSSFGPAPELDGSAVQAAAIIAAFGLLGVVAVVAGRGARLAADLVDRPPRRRRRFVPPWELVPVALAAVSLARLEDVSGIRLAGVPAADVDLFAQAFPAFALVAVGAVAVRPLRWVFAHGRHGGRRLAPGVLRGWRRLGADPGRHALLAGAVCVGVGACLVGGSIADTLERAQADKAATFLGADLRVVVDGEPQIPSTVTATPIARTDAMIGDVAVQVLGIDPATFADVVRWHDDASEYPLAELLRVLQVGDMEGAPLPAILVGAVPSGTARVDGGERIDITPVATAEYFPGKTSLPLLVVNRDALAADEVPTAGEIWLRDPPADATIVLANAGNRVLGAQAEFDVFDAGASIGARWSAQLAWALAAFMALAALLAALLIVADRRADRRAGWVIGRRIGMTSGEEALAMVVAFGLPGLFGLVAGIVAGWVVVRVTASELDTVANLPPPLHASIDWWPSLAVAFAVCAAVVVIAAAVSVVGTTRTDETEVLRDALPA